jgi:hypothetical protein
MYTPQTLAVYLNAAAGCMAGITSQATTDISPGDYTMYAQMADAYAQQLDTTLGAFPAVPVIAALALSISEAVWENRSPYGLPDAVNPGSYTQIASSVAARITQLLTQITNEGIFIPTTGARVVTPNTESSFAANGDSFVPAEAGRILAVVDITPTASGLLIVNAAFAVSSNASDIPSIALFYIDLLTGITGGSALPGASAITRLPTNTTPAHSGSPVFVPFQGTVVLGPNNVAQVSFPGVPVTAVPGHRTGLVFFAQSTSNSAQWTVGGSVSIIEQP